jgi:membrane protein DedA with SNARE-associated domain
MLNRVCGGLNKIAKYAASVPLPCLQLRRNALPDGSICRCDIAVAPRSPQPVHIGEYSRVQIARSGLAHSRSFAGRAWLTSKREASHDWAERILGMHFGMHFLYHIIRHALVRWGYLAVIAGLMGESAGLPLPSEATLMFASFLSHKTSHLQLAWVIVAGIGAAIAGDNIGFLLGRHFGPRLLQWLAKTFSLSDNIAVARDQIQRHGPAMVFWSRFIVGLRTITGPVAGALGMEWKSFLIFNALGGTAWVMAISLCGYFFANEFQSMLDFSRRLPGLSASGYSALDICFGAARKSASRSTQGTSALHDVRPRVLAQAFAFGHACSYVTL